MRGPQFILKKSVPRRRLSLKCRASGDPTASGRSVVLSVRKRAADEVVKPFDEIKSRNGEHKPSTTSQNPAVLVKRTKRPRLDVFHCAERNDGIE